jgi:hypothetical protein
MKIKIVVTLLLLALAVLPAVYMIRRKAKRRD